MSPHAIAATAHVDHGGAVEEAAASWVTQQVRNVSWELNQHVVPARFPIHDHDDQYGGDLDRVIEGDGMAVIRTPIAAQSAKLRASPLDSATAYMSRQPPGYFVPIELAYGSLSHDTALERRHYLRLVD